MSSLLLLLSSASVPSDKELPNFPLRALCNSSELAHCVEILIIQSPPEAPEDSTTEENISMMQTKGLAAEPLALVELIATFQNLKRFEGTAARCPPLLLKSALPHLRHLQEVVITFPQNFDGKWQAPLLAHLPGTLTKVVLSFLATSGLKQLQELLPRAKRLVRLELNDCSTLDDATLAACGQKSSSLEILCIQCMTGANKVTEKGFKILLEHANNLRALILVDFEGRLSKSTWSKVERIASPNFQKLVIAYSETPQNHHSWFLDHVTSGGLAHLLRLARLRELRLERLTHPSINSTPLLHQLNVPMEPMLEPQALPSEIGLGCLEQTSLESLCLDLFTVTHVQLQNLLSLPSLQDFRVMVSASLTRVVGHSLNFDCCKVVFSAFDSLPKRP